MTIIQRSFTCLCAALLLCFGALHAQQPTQQRFLRFLGQRSVTTGTAGVSLVAEGRYVWRVVILR